MSRRAQTASVKTSRARQRTGAALMILGAGILLFRTLSMLLWEHALEMLAAWAVVLLFVELALDAACLIASAVWFIAGTAGRSGPALRLGAAATLLHALRVLVYVLGRTGPLLNFDVKPEYQAAAETDWFWVGFAAVLAALGVAGVVAVWLVRRRSRKSRGD